MVLTLPVWLLVLAALLLLAVAVLITRALVSRRWQLRVADDVGQVRLQLQTKLAECQTLLREEQRRAAEYRQDDEARSRHLQAEFERLANRIFEDKQSRFTQSSKETLDSTLRPLRDQVESFRKRVDEVHRADTADRNRLQGQIEELQKQARQIGSDAVNLAKALKGDSKMQGNWGEVVLERLLEQSGLLRGSEYEVQSSFVGEDGSRYLPDVIVKLPEQRAMIIDSKVSLLHYQDYINENDDTRKAQLLRAHIQSIRTHFMGLSRKSYQNIEALDTVDFVFMFVPVEPAYLLALREEPGLFDEAFGRQVTLVSHTTLMPMLKTVQSLWRNEKQNSNALEIARSAGELHDKFVLMLESLDEVGQQLDKTREAYEKTRNRLGEGRGNLVSWVGKLQVLGARTRKEMPKSVSHLLDEDSGGESSAED